MNILRADWNDVIRFIGGCIYLLGRDWEVSKMSVNQINKHFRVSNTCLNFINLDDKTSHT